MAARWRWRALGASGLVLAAACGLACGGATSEARPERAGVTDGGSFAVEWAPVPDPIPLNEMFSVLLRVSEAGSTGDATLPGDLEVEVDAGMPGHGHGMNVQPRVTATGDGRFEARGFLFHMPGEWQVVVTVKRGTVTERARFPVDVE